ncbi:hypothetical protein FIU97_09565 [Roseivivax sp. THAF40]|uniref:hypothetical protein n=1 Tax=Roseivivax sp. THAF40 TaxID=2587858 RepID=UPI001268FCC0|nr:hypothetical protein [Roseivivax sp. THAF40]QFT46818.1 hypothetical protein FIU97_09565 [Roseivivax sp. THAF40]
MFFFRSGKHRFDAVESEHQTVWSRVRAQIAQPKNPVTTRSAKPITSPDDLARLVDGFEDLADAAPSKAANRPWDTGEDLTADPATPARS